MARRQNATGGYGVGFDTGSARLARDAAIQGTGAARDTELGLQGEIRENRFKVQLSLSGAEYNMLIFYNQVG